MNNNGNNNITCNIPFICNNEITLNSGQKITQEDILIFSSKQQNISNKNLYNISLNDNKIDINTKKIYFENIIDISDTIIYKNLNQNINNKTLINCNVNNNDYKNNQNNLTSNNFVHTNININIPCGVILLWPNNIIPSGWLICDGSLLSKIEYINLFNVIGYLYGGYENNFNIPNTQGLFIRSVGQQNINGMIYKSELGNIQNDNIRQHNHTYKDTCFSYDTISNKLGVEINNTNDNTLYYRTNNNDITNNNQNNNIDLQTSIYGNGLETYPANIGLYYIIKAFNSNDVFTNNIINTPNIFNSPFINNNLSHRYIFNLSTINNQNLGNIYDGNITFDAILSDINMISLIDISFNKSTLNLNNNYVSINNISFNNNGISICFWIKPNSNGIIFETGINNDQYNKIIMSIINNNLGLYISNNNNDIYNLNVISNINDNIWKHITWIINNNNTWLLYINGILSSVQIAEYILELNKNYFYIGCNGNLSNNLVCSIYDFRIYNGILNNENINKIYNNNG